MNTFNISEKNESKEGVCGELYREWCAQSTSAESAKGSDRKNIEKMLMAEAPGEFIGLFLKYYKKKEKTPLTEAELIRYVDEMVEILVSNKVGVHNGFVLAQMINVFKQNADFYPRKRELGILLEKRDRLGLSHEREKYWQPELFGYLLGREAYPWLIERVRSDERFDDRAAAAKTLARISGQRFDRGLPKDAGKWKLEDLRIDEIEEWIAEGCPDGEGYQPPILDPALDAPTSELEMAVSALNGKLKGRQDTRDYSSYDNYLVCADGDLIERLTKLYELSGEYLEFLTRFSPSNVCIEKGMYEVRLYGASELEEFQVGYSVDDKGNAFPEWPRGYLVIADRLADPYCIDTTGKKKGILLANHGEGDWKFSKKFDSFVEFLLYLAK